MARASSPFPVPLSPVMSTVARARCDLFRDAIHLLHRRARSDEALEAFARLRPELAPEVLRFRTERAPFARALNRHDQGIDVERLCHVILDTRAHGGDCIRNVAERRRNDHGQIGIGFVELLRELDTVHVRHLQVGHDDVGGALGGDGERRNAVFRDVDGVLLAEQFLKTAAGGELIVDNQHVDGAGLHGMCSVQDVCRSGSALGNRFNRPMPAPLAHPVQTMRRTDLLAVGMGGALQRRRCHPYAVYSPGS